MMPSHRTDRPEKSPWRLPWRIELQSAKLLNTLGFSDYGSLLWELAIKEKSRRAEPRRALSSEISGQIREQARHDPSVVAAGEKAFPALRQLSRGARDVLGVDSRALLESEERPEILIVIPTVDMAETQPAAKVLELLRLIGARSFLILITDQPSDAVANARPELPDARFLFWADHCSGTRDAHPRLLALFIHAIGASIVVVDDSRLGLETIGRYGLALKRFHRLFCMMSAPAEADAHLFREVHHLRAVAPHAKILAFDDEQARVLLLYSAGLDGPGIEVLPLSGAGSFDRASSIFGRDLGDHRPDISQAVISKLRSPPRQSACAPALAPVQSAPRGKDLIDITVTIVFHREKVFAAPALASLADMISSAGRAGLKVEARAMLDNTDDATRRLIETNGEFLDDVQTVSFGDPSLTRNSAAVQARGRYLAFLDGDDLWGSEWLSRGYRAATADEASRATVWHPTNLFSFFGSDCDRHSSTDVPLSSAWSQHLLHIASSDPHFEPRDLLFENLWSVNALAATEIFLRFPYRPNNYTDQIGIEDWRWNLETFGSGVRHLLVPDTVHLIRQKVTGSLGQTHGLQDLLPILT